MDRAVPTRCDHRSQSFSTSLIHRVPSTSLGIPGSSTKCFLSLRWRNLRMNPTAVVLVHVEKSWTDHSGKCRQAIRSDFETGYDGSTADVQLLHKSAHSTVGDHCALKMFNAIRKLRPGVLRFFEYGRRWWGKVRIGERPDRCDVQIRADIRLPIQGRSTVGAKIEANLPTRLSSPLEDLCEAFDPDLSLRQGGTAGCDCPGPTLACLAVTDIDQ